MERNDVFTMIVGVVGFLIFVYLLCFFVDRDERRTSELKMHAIKNGVCVIDIE